MEELNTKKVALVVAFFIGGWHLVWSALILIGFAQQLLDFVFWMHMIANPYQITGFSITQSVMLIVATFIFGYIGGFVFAWLWNKLHK